MMRAADGDTPSLPEDAPQRNNSKSYFLAAGMRKRLHEPQSPA